MNDQDKTKQQLLDEVVQLRQRVVLLEASERRFRTIVDMVPLTIAVTDREGVVVFANAATEKMLGYTSEEIVGTSAWDRIEAGPAREAFRTWFHQTIAEQPPPVPAFDTRVKKNGQRVEIRGDWDYLRNEQAEVTGLVTVAADITQSTRAEAELAKSKAILTAAVECLPFDVFALGPDGRCILQNAVSRQYYGDALGKSTEEVCPDERLLPRWLENNRRAFAGERVEEDVGWTVEGEPRSFHNIITPIRDGGQVIGILGVNVDITTRKRAEEALRQSERRYRALAESTRDIIYILDRQGTLLYANRAAAQCIGINAAEIPGKRQADLFPPEMARAHLEKIGRVFTAGEVVEEDELFHFGPEEVWLRIHLLPLRDEAGEISSVMGVCHNITDRKRAEEALRAAHDELDSRVQKRTAELTSANEELAIFRQFAEAAGQGFSMADLDGRLLYLNPTLCRMLGEKRPENRIGQPLSIYFSEEANRRGKEEIEPILRQRGHWEGELPMLSRQGISIPTWQNSFLIRDERGNPLRFAVVITDITTRKQAQEALQQEHRTLRHLLQSSDHERQLIAYEIHDELAQQLAGAIMQFQAFSYLKDAKPDDAAKAFDAGVTMLEQSHVEVRRLISGVRPPILDEEGIVAAISHLVNEESRQKGRKIEYLSKVDFKRLTPILENAIYRIAQESLTNACRHSKADIVYVELVQRDDQIRIEVRDHGVGFTPEDVGESRFGLDGIRERARLLGGKATIESRPGQGTKVMVELPIVLRRPEDEPPEDI